MNTHVSKTGTEAEKNGAKFGIHVAMDSANSEPHQTAAEGESQQADPMSQESAQGLFQSSKRLLAGAKHALIPFGKWVQEQSEAHPYLTIAASMGASALAGALVRKRAAMRVGLTMGILTAVYVRRKRRQATPPDASTGA